MSDRRIHTILTIQSKAYLLGRLSEVPEQIFLFVVTKDHPQTTHRVLWTLSIGYHFPIDPNKERYFDQPILKRALRSLLNFETS